MIVAEKLREKNKAEYLLYMWQVENILRVWGCDIFKIKAEYLDRFSDLPPETRERMENWYADLCEMMRAEGKTEHGHLQICLNTQNALENLHADLLKSSEFPYYAQMYRKVLPELVELRSRGDDRMRQLSEIGLMLEFLYGIMMIRLQKQPVSDATAEAVKDISALLGTLSDYMKRDDIAATLAKDLAKQTFA